MTVFHILLAILIFFPFLFLLKELSGKYFCVICVSVSATWIVFVSLFRFGYFSDPVIVALLMGESILGIYYLVEKRVSEMLLLFRLPFLLTLTVCMYLLLMGQINGLLSVVILLFVVWGIAGVVYFWRRNPQMRKIAKKMIACCRGW